MKKYTKYEIEVVFEQYESVFFVKYEEMAEGFDQAKEFALKNFWNEYGEEHNLRIHHITITEYN